MPHTRGPPHTCAPPLLAPHPTLTADGGLSHTPSLLNRVDTKL